jgi:hypothetical protein
MVVLVRGIEPASYTGTFTVGALNDDVPGNNTGSAQIIVRPFADAGVSPISGEQVLILGVPRDITFEVFTGPTRPVQAVRVTVPTSQSITLESLSATTGTCSAGSAECVLGDLPPNSRVQVTARYLANSAGGMSTWVSTSALWDADYSNDDESVSFWFLAPGDAALSVASASISGNVGSTIDLPRITIDTLVQTEGGEIEIPLPAFVTIQTFSFSGGICSGTTLLRCYVSPRGAGSHDDIDIRVRIDSAGTFTSNMVVRMRNDTNPGNDQATLQLQGTAVVVPPANPPSSSSSSSSSGGGGGGGGGRFEWLALALMVWMVARRVNVRTHGSAMTGRAAHRRVSSQSYVALR